MIHSRRVCLFGGSFDPVHLGHTALAETVWEHCGLEKVIFIPAWQSPHKPDDAPAPAADRLAMLELALKGRAWAEISRWEIEQPTPSYSWQTAEYFAGSFGSGVELCWLLGADQWKQLRTWAHPEKLASLLTFLVFPRNGIEIGPQPGLRYELIDFRAPHPASSSAVRTIVRAGGALDGWVDPAVADYITSRRLYR
jgi:nicotinate-nucleotide adenylyltransferase